MLECIDDIAKEDPVFKSKLSVLVLFSVVLIATALPAAAQSVSIGYDNNLFVQGSHADDEIILKNWIEDGAPMGVTVMINGQDFGPWRLDERTGITVRGWEGNDYIDLSDVTHEVFFLEIHPNFSITITGDSGDDVIKGSEGNDVIYGGTGSDDIDAGPGDDIVLGGADDDLLRGGDGNDVVDGEAGPYDRVYGGCGNDKVSDKDGVQYISGDDGNDKILVKFPEGWTLNKRLRLMDRIFGGNDADYVEIHNLSTTPMLLRVDGDENLGYNDSGDQLVTFGPIDPESTFKHFERIQQNP